jgi:hypothetical protein
MSQVVSGSRKSSLMKEPVNPPGRAVTYTSNVEDKGYKNFTQIGTHNIWTPPAGKNVTLLSYKLAGFNNDPSQNVIAFLEYKVVENSQVYWEIIDFMLMPAESGVQSAEAILEGSHVITCLEVRVRIVGNSNQFEVHALVEGKEAPV